MRKIAIGCGIAALVIAVLLVGAGVFTVRWVKDQMVDAERLTRIASEMESEYGAPETFVPPADGRYAPERIELFTRLRGELQDTGAGLRESTNRIADGGKQRWWNKVRTMIELLNSGAGYLATADSLLLDAGMGHGEYAHYQTLLLHGEFGTSPTDFVESSPQMAADTEFASAFDEFVDEYMAEARRLLLAHARNARDAADSLGATCATCPAWSAYLQEQIEASHTQRGFIPMTDPLPASLTTAFEAERARLEATLPEDMGAWLLEILMVIELEDDGNGIRFEIGD